MIILSFGCTTVHQELDPKIYYKRDMSIKIDGHKHEGIAVLPGKIRQKIEFKSAGKMDLFTFTTCHREHTNEDATSFFNKKKVTFEYTPEPQHEGTGSCPIQVAGYDINGKHTWAYMDMETLDATLPATLKCNGKTIKSNGVSICQSKEGLVQSIKFQNEVVFSPEASLRKKCREIDYKTEDNKEFIFKMPNRECTYNFISLRDSEKKHRLTTIGYEAILIREL